MLRAIQCIIDDIPLLIRLEYTRLLVEDSPCTKHHYSIIRELFSISRKRGITVVINPKDIPNGF